MSNPIPVGIQFLIGDIRKSPDTRCTEGVKVGAQAPQSALYIKWSDLKLAADDVVSKTTLLGTATDDFHKSVAAMEKARSDMEAATLVWDGVYDVYLTIAAKYVTNEQEAKALALALRERARNPLAMPLAVLIGYNVARDWIRIHVKRAPGMDVVSVEVSTDISNPANWKELDGAGALQFIKNPAKGTWYARAASKTAHAKSDFTTPVSVIVK